VDLRTLSLERIADVPWVAFDTEATGFSNVTDRLLEVAGVRFHREPGQWVVDGEYSELVNPGRPIPEVSKGVHGISDTDVARAPLPLEVLERFFQFAKGAVLMAHYAPFDVGAIAFAHVRQGKSVPDFAILDTFPLSKLGVPGLQKYSLITLASHLGLPTDDHHRALPDARATRILFQRCVESIGDPDELEMSALLERTGAPLTFEAFTTLPHELPESLRPLEKAIAEGRDVTLEYRGGSRGGTPRRVTPSHLFAREGHVFLEGLCHLDSTKKSFRLDRIERVTVLPAA
jgi:DNA polymerase-3 subunit epsilon